MLDDEKYLHVNSFDHMYLNFVFLTDMMRLVKIHLMADKLYLSYSQYLGRWELNHLFPVCRSNFLQICFK